MGMAGEYKDSEIDRNIGQGDPTQRPATPPAGAAAPLRIDILTIFPDMFAGPFDHSMIRRARESGLVDIRVHDLRRWAGDRHHTTDDYAYGGGGGMVMKPEPLFEAVEDLLGIPPLSAGDPRRPPHPVVLMTPQGRRFDHALARELAAHDRLVILAGHYEGFDERVRLHLATHEVSVGDFVVTGGELPAMLVADAVTRLRPGVIGLATATETDSFATGPLEHPHYTRPADFRGLRPPRRGRPLAAAGSAPADLGAAAGAARGDGADGGGAGVGRGVGACSTTPLVLASGAVGGDGRPRPGGDNGPGRTGRLMLRDCLRRSEIPRVDARRINPRAPHWEAPTGARDTSPLRGLALWSARVYPPRRCGALAHLLKQSLR